MGGCGGVWIYICVGLSVVDTAPSIPPPSPSPPPPLSTHMQLVAVSITKMFLFVSRDGGRRWTRYSLPSSRFDPTNNLYLSRKNPRHMVLLTDNGKVREEKWEGEWEGGGGESGKWEGDKRM